MLLPNCDEDTLHDLASLEALIVGVAHGCLRQARPLRHAARFRCRQFAGPSGSLFYLNSDFETAVDFEPVDYLRIVFPLEKNCCVTIPSGPIHTGSRQPGYILPQAQPISEHHPDGYRSLAVRLEPDYLHQVACDMLDEAIDPPIMFEAALPENTSVRTFLRDQALVAAQEIGTIPAPFRTYYWKCFEGRLVSGLLLHGAHSLSRRFQAPARDGGSRRIRIIEDYIRTHLGQPLQLQDLARISQASAKTVYNDFINYHNKTPHAYIKSVRLEAVRQMILQNETNSIMVAALQCGFASFGHFANAYRQQYGELPSATMKRHHNIAEE